VAGDSDARARFAALVARPEPPLDETALAIAAEEYPGLDPAPQLAELDRLGALVRSRTTTPVRAASALRALREVLFVEERFKGNSGDYDDPRNSFLNDVLERRLGIPISLSVVAIEVARRAGLALDGVGFPGHFLVRYASPGGPEVFLDAFHGGDVLSGDEVLERFREKSGRRHDRRLLAPMPPRRIIGRMLRNLARVSLAREDLVRAWWVADRLVLTEPDDADALRDRGLAAARLGVAEAAVHDLETWLERAPEQEDAARIRELVSSLRARPRMLS